MLTNKTFVTKEMLKTVIDQVGLAFRGYKNEDFEKHLKESDIKFKAIEDILGQALNVVSEILPNYQTGIKQNAANIAVLDKTIKDHKTELDAKDAELETAIDDKYTQAIAYVDEMYQKVLGGDVKEAYDTFKKLQDYIETHNTEFADVLASISALGAMDESLNSTITSNKEDVDAEIAELKANDETITSNIEQVRTDLIAYADNIHQTLLGEGVDEAYNTFKEFQTYVETHGDEIISIINRIDALEAKDTELEDVDAEVKAAFATISQAVGELQTNQNAIIDTLNGTDETTGLVPLTTAMSRIVNQHTEILKQVAYADSLDALHGIVTDNKAEVDGEITTLKESDTALEAKIDDREAALRGTYPERVNESDYDTLAKVATDVVDILTVITNQRDYNEKFFKDLGNVTNSKDAEDELLKKDRKSVV